ncbi:MAG: alcohol dehydrogenase catalytic domain-containing protein [Spirochaetota bacterium]|nr:MAG: alcohol dehydrogenase catalytic domain-containing protein [Spirochaetota bacterium]
MKALLCYSIDDFRLEDMAKPSISDSDILIEMLYCGLCGSDIVKIFDTSFRKPAIYGHEIVGKVVEVGKKVDEFSEGDIVVASHHIPCGTCHFCKHGNYTMCDKFKSTNIVPGGFCQYIKLSSDHIENTTFTIPEDMNLLEAVFIEPLACCLRAMDSISCLEGDIVSVVGAGVIGILFVKLIKLSKLRALVIDLDDDRLSMAKKLGADYTFNPKKEFASEKIRDISPIGLDAAILTVTNPQTLSDALSYIRPGGQIVIFGMGIENKPISVDFNRIYKNELIIKSSYSQTPEYVARAYGIIVNRQIDVTPLISDAMPLADFKKGLDLMLDRKIYKAIYNGRF